MHRDVSVQNIVLGKPGSEQGNRGILIDLDMATRQGEDGFHPSINWQIVRVSFSQSSHEILTRVTGHSSLPVGNGAHEWLH